MPATTSSPRTTSRADILDRLAAATEGYRRNEIAWPAGFTEATSRPVYALPVNFLQVLRRHLPEVLSEEEWARESAFGAWCSSQGSLGYYLGEGINHPFFRLADPVPIDDGHFQELCEMWGFSPENPGWAGTSAADLNRRVRWGEENSQLLFERLQAFLGWLLTNRSFLEEFRRLRSLCESMPSESPSAGSERAFVDFCHRWNLAGMATWDLPVPIGFNAGAPSSASRSIGLRSEPVMQLPGSMVLPERVPVRRILSRAPAPPLQEWHSIQNRQGPGDHGPIRYRRIFHYHVLRNVLLGTDHEERLHRKEEKLDRVFAEYLECSEETIRKDRLWMKQHQS